MGYLRKNNTVANPAKKSLTVFQNSYQVWDHDDVQYGTRSVPIYGKVKVEFVTDYVPYQGSYENCTNRSNITIRIYTGNTAVDIPPNQTRATAVGGSWRRELYNAANGQRVYEGDNTVVGYRTETYEVSRTPVYRTDWNTKWRKLSA